MDNVCCFVGEGPLLVDCVLQASAKGFKVGAVVSPHLKTQTWAKEQQIPEVVDITALSSVLAARRYDFLFSVTNYSLLTSEQLDQVSRAAVNYHDSLLPDYAGLNATSWAIFNGEAEHGVSWHLMTDEIDGGPVLAQSTISIEAKETVRSLDIKCFDAGRRLFADLLDKFIGATPVVAERRESRPTEAQRYFGKYDRPCAGGLLDWRMSAKQIADHVRACPSKSERNTFGLSRLPLGTHRVLTFDEVEVCETKSDAPPGTVVACYGGEDGREDGREGKRDDNTLTVTTGTADLRFSSFFCETGERITVDEALVRFDISVGDCLSPTTLPDKLNDACVRALRNEAFWLQTLLTKTPLALPFAHRVEPLAASAGWWKRSMPIEGSAADRHLGEHDLVFLFCMFVQRLTATEGDSVDLIVSANAATQDPAGGAGGQCSSALIDQMLSHTVPLKLPALSADSSVGDALAAHSDVVQKARERGGFLSDLYCRYDGLSELEGAEIVLDFYATADPDRLRDARLIVQSDGEQISLSANAAYLSEMDFLQLCDSFQQFAAAASRDLSQLVVSIPTRTRDQKTICERVNDTRSYYDELLDITTLIDRRAQLQPDATAVVHGSTSLTYAELVGRSNALAWRLYQEGCAEGELVGLYCNRGVEMVVALLAILKTGAGYVPLDPELPAERIALMIQDAEVLCVVADKASRIDLESMDSPVVTFDLADYEPLASDGLNLPIPRPDSIAYVIYTSGSTGKPKGVRVTHRNVTNLVNSLRVSPGMAAEDSILAITTVCFDIVLTELLLPLVVGAKTIVLDTQIIRDGDALKSAIETHHPTIVQATPSTWRMLLSSGWEGDDKLKAISTGEALPNELSVVLVDKVGVLWNLFGPTEATVFASSKRIGGEGEVTIGTPIHNTQMYVLDKWKQPVPPGVVGELFIGGDGVAAGYLNRSELNARSFLRDWLNPANDGTLYRTADLVRLSHSGEFEFLKRADNQVKIRGYRIELAEIETVLAKHPQIASSIVLVHENKRGNKKILAFCIVEGALSDLDQTLKAWAGELLPHYMVPARTYQIASIPLTPSGKIDRRGLLSIHEQSGTTPEEGRQQKTGSVEGDIKTVWEDVLGHAVKPKENFFDVGGDSISLIEVSRQLGESYSIEVTTTELLVYPTIEQLAAYLKGGLNEPVGPLKEPASKEPAGNESANEAVSRSGSRRHQRALRQQARSKARLNIS